MTNDMPTFGLRSLPAQPLRSSLPSAGATSVRRPRRMAWHGYGFRKTIGDQRTPSAEIRRRAVKVTAMRIAQLRAEAAKRLSDASNELLWSAGLSPPQSFVVRGTLAEGVPNGEPDVEGLTRHALENRGELRAVRAAYTAALAPAEGSASEERVQQLDRVLAERTQAIRNEVANAARRLVAARRALATCDLDPKWRTDHWTLIARAAAEQQITVSEALVAARDALELELQCIADGVELSVADADLRRAASLNESDGSIAGRDRPHPGDDSE